MQQQQAGGAASATGAGGWIAFAAVMTGATGALNLIDGLVALYRSSYFRDSFVIGNLRIWAIAFIAFGALQVAAGVGIYSGQGWARWFAIVTVALNAFLQLLAVGSYPFYSLVIIAYDIAILYALAAHWRRRVTVA